MNNSNKTIDIHDLFKRKHMLRHELLPFLGPKDMVVFALLNKTSY